MAKLIEKRQERNGTWTLRIANDAETRSVFLSFKTEPTLKEAKAAFDDLVEAERLRREEERAEQEAEENHKITIREAIVKYEAGQLTNAQSKALLDAMIAKARKLEMI
jgi:hypothetical protein